MSCGDAKCTICGKVFESEHRVHCGVENRCIVSKQYAVPIHDEDIGASFGDVPNVVYVCKDCYDNFPNSVITFLKDGLKKAVENKKKEQEVLYDRYIFESDCLDMEIDRCKDLIKEIEKDDFTLSGTNYALLLNMLELIGFDFDEIRTQSKVLERACDFENMKDRSEVSNG